MLNVVAELEFAEAVAESTAALVSELFEDQLHVIVLMPLPPSFVRLET